LFWLIWIPVTDHPCKLAEVLRVLGHRIGDNRRLVKWMHELVVSSATEVRNKLVEFLDAKSDLGMGFKKS